MPTEDQGSLLNEPQTEAPSRWTKLRVVMRKAAAGVMVAGGLMVLAGSLPARPITGALGASMIDRGITEYKTAEQQEGLPAPQDDTDVLDRSLESEPTAPAEAPAPLDGN